MKLKGGGGEVSLKVEFKIPEEDFSNSIAWSLSVIGNIPQILYHILALLHLLVQAEVQKGRIIPQDAGGYVGGAVSFQETGDWQAR